MIGLEAHEAFDLLVEPNGLERASTLLVASCDAFALRLRPDNEDVEQFEELVQSLFPAAAPAARARAAATLARVPHLSQALEDLVVDNIGADLSDFLIAAPTLTQATMLRIAERNDAVCAAALARRSDLPNIVLAKLFHMNSRRVYRALAGNTSIPPRGLFLSALARSAQMDHQVAWSLAAREDFDCALLAPAFFDLCDADRFKVIRAFAVRKTPEAPIKRTIEQFTVSTQDLSRALMRLFAENRRPEITRLFTQITGLDDFRCAQVAHDVTGAALFVVLRAFGCTAYEGLKVLIHASAHDMDQSRSLAELAQLFDTVSPDAMAFLMSAWRGEVNLLDLSKPEYASFAASNPHAGGLNLRATRSPGRAEMGRYGVEARTAATN